MREGKNIISTFHSRGVSVTLYKSDKTPFALYYFRYDGKTYQGSTKVKHVTGDDEAMREVASDIVQDVVSGRYNPKVKGLTLEMLLKRYIEVRSVEKKWDKETIADYNVASKFIIEWGGNKPVEGFVNASFHGEYKEWRRQYHIKHAGRIEYKRLNKKTGVSKTVVGMERKPVGNRSLVRELGLLISALRWGQRALSILQDITISPMEKIALGKRLELFDANEYENFQKYLWDNDRFLYWLSVFLVHTGMRFDSEIRRFERRHIDAKEGVIHINGRKNKNKSTVINCAIPIDERIQEALDYAVNRPVVGGEPDSKIWVNDNGVLVSSSNIRKHWKKAMKSAGISKQIVPYTLRHQAITRWWKLDYNLQLIMMMSGHKNPQVLIDTYSHLDLKALKKRAYEIESERRKDIA